jgi:glycerophosphoryl diester phosphodiesterase
MTRPLLLGHRGARASYHISENTLASFELCLEHGCDGFEFDVRRSGDGVAVVCHDPVIRGMEIERASAKNLGLHTLEEVLRQFSTRAFLDIELKVAGLEAQTIAVLSEFPPRKGYVVSSFSPEALSALHGLDASIPLGLLCEQRDQLPTGRTMGTSGREGAPVSPSSGLWDLSAEWVIPQVDLVDQVLAEQLHAAGKKVMVWTVNRDDEMHRLTQWGVDAIISDETASMVRALK